MSCDNFFALSIASVIRRFGSVCDYLSVLQVVTLPVRFGCLSGSVSRAVCRVVSVGSVCPCLAGWRGIWQMLGRSSVGWCNLARPKIDSRVYVDTCGRVCVCVSAGRMMEIGRVMLISLAHGYSYHLFLRLSVLFGSAICFVFSFLRMFFVLTSRFGHIVIRHSEMLPSSGAPLANLHISNLHISNLHIYLLII